MVYKMNESIIVIQAEAINPIQTNVVFWSHDRGTAKLRMKLVRKNGVPQSLTEGTTVPIRLMFKSATAEGGYGKHDYLATVEDPVNGIVSIVLEDNILGYVGTVEGSVYIDFPNDRSLDTAGRFTFYIKRSPIDDSTPELEDYYFNGFSQTIDKIEKILADGKLEIEQKIAESETQIDGKLKETNDKITKANQKITEYDQNLNELRNDLKLSEAWAWSADGTDRFTDKYPIDNLLPNSMFNSQMGWTASMLDVGSTQSGIANGEAWLEDLTATTSRWKQWQIYFDNNRYPDTFELIKANPNKRVTVSVDAKVEGNTIKNPVVVELSLRSSTGDNWVRLRVDDTKISSEYIRYTAIGTLPSDFNNVQNFRLILMFTGNGRATFTKPKLAIGNDGFYTPAPSEDYENAYPQYRGLALLPSDLPDDYSWDLAPEYVEDNLATDVKISEITTNISTNTTDISTLQNKNLFTQNKSTHGLTWIAHRGNNSTAPENSIVAFENVYRHQAIETDIQLTSDNRWVVMHDETVDRTTNGTGKISDMTYDQFRALRIDTGANVDKLTDDEKIPPNLEEFLLICKKNNRIPVVEIKATGGYTKEQLQLIKTISDGIGMTEKTIFISFNYDMLVLMREIFPFNELQWVYQGTINTDVITKLKTLGLPCGLDINENNASLTKDNVNLLHANRLKIGAWTVGYNSFEKMKDLGIDYITTNSPSGYLKYAELSLLNGFTPTIDNGQIPQFAAELEGGYVFLSFNVKDGANNNQLTEIAKLPDWAIPHEKQYNQCMIRTSNGVSLATFDTQGWKHSTGVTEGTITIGLGWSSRTTWAAGQCIYKID